MKIFSNKTETPISFLLNQNSQKNCYIFSPQPPKSSVKEIDHILNLQNSNSIISVLHADFHPGPVLPVGTSLLNYNSVSPDAIGYDINCGVSVVNLKISKSDFIKNREKIIEILEKKIEVGRFNSADLKNLANKNSENQPSIEEILNFGLKNIKNENKNSYFEFNGSVEGNIKYISQKARKKAKETLKSVGSGNHYIEFVFIDEIYGENIIFNENSLFSQKKDTVLAMIHTGSRGLGHQVCTDYTKQFNYLKDIEQSNVDVLKFSYFEDIKSKFLDNFEKNFNENFADFNEKKIAKNFYQNYNTNLFESKILKRNQIEIKNSPIFINLKSELGKKYFSALNSSKNFAYANRYLLANDVIEICESIFKIKGEVLSDSSHNSASLENSNFLDCYNGKNFDYENFKNVKNNFFEDFNKNYFVLHRKGASKVLSPELFDHLSDFSKTGHPFVIGGSMCTSSIISFSNSFAPNHLFSSCHGSGRIIPRSYASKLFDGKKIEEILEEKNIKVIGNEKELRQENLYCYRDIDQVQKYLNEVKSGNSRFKVRPLLVIKG